MKRPNKIDYLTSKKLDSRFAVFNYYNDLENYVDELEKAVKVIRCFEELNPEFEIGEQVLLTKRTVVIIETFCEDGMIEIDDNNEYYKVDKEELSKRV